MTIRNKVLASLPWTALETASSAALGLVSMLVLSRFLTPAEFGLATLALVFGQYGDLITGSLMTAPIIQRPELSPRALDTAFWMSVALGGAALLASWGASAPIARWYERPELTDYVRALGIGSFLTGISVLPQALLARQLDLRDLAVRSLAGRLLATIATIALAIEGYGAWAIVAGALAGVLFSAILFWTAGIRRPRLQFSPECCLQFLAFGWSITAQELVWSAVNRIFPLMVGLFHGAEAVGYLSFATRLADTVVGLLSAGVFRLGLPMFSALQGRKPAIRRAFDLASRYTFVVVAPALVGLAAVAQDVVPMLFGKQWRPATTIVEIMALYNAVLFTRAFVAPCITALGEPRRNLVTTIVAACAVIAGGFATQHAGMTTVALVWAARLVFSVPVSVYQISAILGLTAVQQFRPFLVPSLACAGMFLAVEITRYLSPALGAAALALTIPVGALVYLLLISLLDRSLLTQPVALARSAPFAASKTNAT